MTKCFCNFQVVQLKTTQAKTRKWLGGNTLVVKEVWNHILPVLPIVSKLHLIFGVVSTENCRTHRLKAYLGDGLERQ